MYQITLDQGWPPEEEEAGEAVGFGKEEERAALTDYCEIGLGKFSFDHEGSVFGGPAQKHP